jgi:alpha-D-ribose 1-methylphosphonate 5-triphosphate diphosphatase
MTAIAAVRGADRARDRRRHAWTCAGHLILPGIVDIHGDGFERHLAPRRGRWRASRRDLGSLDAELAANGITTAVIAQFFSWEGGMRGPDFAEALVDALAQTPMRAETLIQLRLEIGMIDDFDRVLALVDRRRHPLRRVERPPAAQGAGGGQAAAAT